ncbi:hypothetical protein [Bacillus sp. FJAT-45350]|uniref:hypothetical protein n=1 Tax=Bacillus sp. FJAT-45350 TaxID=2011014 RepID=UPI000BB7FFE7|nr:hypothetical protein [Bacillus sp. FJAT-45350]
MNKELVERITRLVLERLDISNNPSVLPLSEDEVKHWNSLSLLEKEQGQSKKRTAQTLTPLSSEEVDAWGKITHHYRPSKNGNEETEKVRFLSYL